MLHCVIAMEAIRSSLFWTALWLAGGTAALALATPEDQAPRVSVRGELHCVDRQGRAEPVSASCTADGRRWALKSDDGRLHFFSQSDPRAGIFEDPLVWPRRLQIIGIPLPDRFLEIIHLHSVEEEGLHKIFYRCDVCNITAYAPGPCWCCRDDFEFREELETNLEILQEGRNDTTP